VALTERMARGPPVGDDKPGCSPVRVRNPVTSSAVTRPRERIRQPTLTMENQVDVQTESSPVLEVPRAGAAYAEWRQTGKLPEAKPARPKGDSAPPKESSAEGQEPKENLPPSRKRVNRTRRNRNRRATMRQPDSTRRTSEKRASHRLN
jgi:hypothetical protein